jgi:tRNA 2-thiouridine synthesizing protein C
VSEPKQILCIQSHAPHGTFFGREGLDAVLMASAFCLVRVLFIGDGVLQLLGDQQPSNIGSKDYSVTFGALADYGVTDIFVARADLERLHLAANDLSLAVTPLSDTDITQLLHDVDVVLDF